MDNSIDPLKYIELELEWADEIKNLPKTDMEWLEVFPEAESLVKRNLKAKLATLTSQQTELNRQIKDAQYEANGALPHERVSFEWVISVLEAKLSRLVAEIRRYQWQFDKLSGVVRVSSSGTSPEDIDSARQVPIINFVKHKRAGSTYLTECLFHNDSHPSMTIFKDNKFKCFACGAHGDSIDLIMKLCNLNFIEAIKFLLNK